MADIWRGAIVLPDGNAIKEIGLRSQSVASSPALPPASLRFLATVDTARIPLYLAAGPSVEVWTTSEATEAWFESILSSWPGATPEASGSAIGAGWWPLARSQLPVGILVQVPHVSAHVQKARATEILFYGTIAPSAQRPELRVHALPLSSARLRQQAAVSAPRPSPTPSAADPAVHVEARFLPPLDAQTAPASPKRKRDIFDEATLAQKKARGRGGAGVAAAAARGTESQPPPLGHRKSLSNDTTAARCPDSRPPSSSDALPPSRKGSEAQSKRSHLSHVATAPPQSEEPTTESRNKQTLSRVVMAAMRMHGLQQRKKTRSRRASMAPGVEESQQANEETTAEEAAQDEEYKLVYHQTYKGAAFALRKYVSEKPLHAQPDRLRDVVEKLLAIFLTDPLAHTLPTDEPSNPVATPGSKQRLGIPASTLSHTSPFDLPSIARPGLPRSKADSQVYTGSPVSRRKVHGTDPAPA